MNIKRTLISFEIENPLFTGGYLTLDSKEIGHIKGRSSIFIRGVEAGVYTLSFYGENFILKNSLTVKDGLIHKIHLAHEFQEKELGYRFTEISDLIKNKSDFSRLKELVSIPGILNMKSFKTGKTLLHLAVDSLYYEGTKLLLEAGSSSNTSDKFGTTPLMSAVERSNIELTTLLLESKANVNSLDCHNENVFMKGISSNKNAMDILKLLMAAKVDIDVVSKSSGLTPLLKSLTKKEYAHIFNLIKNFDEKTLYSKDVRGYSSFDLALLGGDSSCIKAVMKHKVSPRSHSSIYKAFNTKDKEIIIYTLDQLLDDGLDIDYPNTEGLTLLMFVCSIGYLEGVKILLDRGVDINKKDLEGESAIFYSLYYPDICALLIEKGANLSNSNLKGETPLMKLIPRKFQETAKLFIK